MDRPQARGALLDFARRYRADADVRARIAHGDTSDLDRATAGIPDEMDIRIVEQTADTFYLPLPPAPSEVLSDEALGAVSGGRAGWMRPGPAPTWDPWWNHGT